MNKLLLTMVLLAACEEPAPAPTVVLEPTFLEHLVPLDVPDLEPMPVVVAPTFATVEREPRAVVGWRSRCVRGFLTLAGGQVLSCKI